MLKYHAAYFKGESGWIVGEVLDFPGALSQGRTLPAARRMIRDALKLMAQTLIEQGEPLPAPRVCGKPRNAVFLELIAQATALGIGESFKADLATIVRKLAATPRSWGDPLYPLRSLQLMMFRGVHAEVAVTYAVHDRLPIVFLRDIQPILDHPLAGA